MAYVITEPCIGCKDKACLDACPVNCIYGADQAWPLCYINPTECIDCGACVPVCPVSAIFTLDDVPDKWAGYAKLAETLVSISLPKQAVGIPAPPVVVDPEAERRKEIERQETQERWRVERERARTELKELIASFEIALQSEHEAPIQRFLEGHPQLVLGYLNGISLKSKFRLGDEFQTDLAVLQRSSGRGLTLRPIFVELESSRLKLFTSKGDPSAGLTHALRQIQDWKLWSVSNPTLLSRRLDKLVDDLERENLRIYYSTKFLRYPFRVHYAILAGRRRDLSEDDIIRLSHMSEDWGDLSIATYDSIIEKVAIDHGFWWDGNKLHDDIPSNASRERFPYLWW